MAILVTGGAGYVGSHMAHALVDRGEKVVVLDDLSTGHSELVFQRASPQNLPAYPAPFNAAIAAQADVEEARLGYYVPSGKYWKVADRFDPAAIDALDALWLAAVQNTFSS